MPTNSNGKVELSPSILVAIVVAALAMGSGGTFFAGSGSAEPHAAAAAHDSRVATLEERTRNFEGRFNRLMDAVEGLRGDIKTLDDKVELALRTR